METSAAAYQVIFSGKIIPGYSREEVVMNLAGRLGVDPAGPRMEKLFSGDPILLHQESDEGQAFQWKKDFERTGADCKVSMLCLACNEAQEPSAACHKCGQIIDPFEYQATLLQSPSGPGRKAAKRAPKAALPSRWRHAAWVLFLQRQLVVLANLPLIRPTLNYLKDKAPSSQAGRRYAGRLYSGVVHMGITFAIVLILSSLFLYLLQMLWFVYASTPLGMTYIASFPAKAQRIRALLGNDPLGLTLDLSLQALYMGLAAGALCQVLHITRYVFEVLGIIQRQLFFGLPLAALISWRISILYGIEWQSALVLSLVPASILLSACFRVAATLLPETGTVLGAIFATAGRFGRRSAEFLSPAMCQWIQRIRKE